MEFTVMVTFPEILGRRIEAYNETNGTDFRIIEIINEEVPFCRIQVSSFQISDVFNLGYGLAVLQYSMRDKGELSW